MPGDRPKIPSSIVRAIKIEAGHRCAIPACKRAGILDICHIVPWSKCKEHKFENLIALCPNCHRLEQDGKIDQKEMKVYKANLGLLNSRYTRIELRVLEDFAHSYRKFGAPQKNTTVITELPGYSRLLVKGLLDDGLIFLADSSSGMSDMQGKPIGLIAREAYSLTEAGWEVVRRNVEAEEIE